MVDSHCHLADDALTEDQAGVIERAKAAGVTSAVCIIAAESETEAARAANLSAAWPAVRFAVGLHPHQAGRFADREADVAAFVRTAVQRVPLVRAIGEIGLDYHYDFAPRDTQQEVFRHQLRLAAELNLPVIIHTREAEEDTIAILKEAGPPLRGVLHCFTGTQSLADEGLSLGLHVSFAGIVTFPKAANLREIAQRIPADRILCETDSPYLAPTPHRGKRNEPAWVVRVAEALAACRHEQLDALAGRMDANFEALFRP
jgi:TatD DNase family protein